MLTKFISEAYTPKPEVHHLNEVYDFKRLCNVGDGMKIKVLAPLNNISFNHLFLIKRDVISHNTTLLFVSSYFISQIMKFMVLNKCRMMIV